MIYSSKTRQHRVRLGNIGNLALRAALLSLFNLVLFVKLIEKPPRRIRRRDSVPQHLLQRSEEHTSELQSLRHLVCRLLLAKNGIGAKVLDPLPVAAGLATFLTTELRR